ncbi:general transcription and DNA repair factor iih helicase subunit xpd [Anaeramoeba flamelloides]|uniref:DNA 5'-3' helicase n=1 Tax=Anaeramoeba flamelloides TaxID=1746091 RepID=A0ABQ8XCY4_9EUKA|nr:general transcription and DNA repair factor iih helicase subunit xpd [Anaeramoeba flamelloides]
MEIEPIETDKHLDIEIEIENENEIENEDEGEEKPQKQTQKQKNKNHKNNKKKLKEQPLLIDIEGLKVPFPFPYVYPEQYQYMKSLKRSLEKGGIVLLEMPTGTGKTVSLYSIILAFMCHSTKFNKLIYCTRTIPELEKSLEELKVVIEGWQYHYERGNLDMSVNDLPSKMICTGLSSRRNLCIHNTVSTEKNPMTLDSMCRGLTCQANRIRHLKDETVSNCPYYEKFLEIEELGELLETTNNYDPMDLQQASILSPGVYTLEDLRKVGAELGICPYYLARSSLVVSSVVVHSYQYVLDPKISDIVIGENLDREKCIVVFDEAHNLDSVCLEALSMNLDSSTLTDGIQLIKTLQEYVEQRKMISKRLLEREYDFLVNQFASNQGYTTKDELPVTVSDELKQNPVLSQDVVEECVPGSIRKSEHFLSNLSRFSTYLSTVTNVKEVFQQTPWEFRKEMLSKTQIAEYPMRFYPDRLMILFKTLEITNLNEYMSLILITNLAALLTTYDRGFLVIIEPLEKSVGSFSDCVFQFVCLDPSICFKPVTKFKSAVITSGTLSPLSFYPKILGFTPVASHSFPMSVSRNCLCPLIVTKGSDQSAISTKFDVRNDPSCVRNYGSLLVVMCKIVPDGIVCFFPSYNYMESIVSIWIDSGVINSVLEHKLLFIETQDPIETSTALQNYKYSCDCGRAAVLFCVARGKVSEGVDFDNHYGRCIILFGVPYPYTEDTVIKARMLYYLDKFEINETDFLNFDAMRISAQCAGRVLRSKDDYGVVIFADNRFNRKQRKNKLPKWILQFLHQGSVNISVDVCRGIAKNFFSEMSVRIPKEKQIGVSLLSENELKNLN